MTAFLQLDMSDVRKVIARISQLPENLVIDGNDEIDVSDLQSFLLVRRLPFKLIGTERKFDAVNEKEIVTSTYETPIAITAFGKNAYSIIEILSASIKTTYAQQLFECIGVGVIRFYQLLDESAAIAADKPNQAQIDLVLSHIHRIETPLYRGRSVIITTKKD